MIAISSVRPMGDNPETDRNQLAAWRSWQMPFTRIFYLNSHQPQLDSRKTTFIPSEPYPRIREMAELAAMQTEWCCLLNADIVIGMAMPKVEMKLKAKKAQCAASWRWNFDPKQGIGSAQVNDLGGDFFAATPEVWKLVSNLAPEELRMGSIVWDSWMLATFSTFFMSGYWNITKSRVVFHPIHGNRRYGPPVDPSTLKVYGASIMSSCHLA